MSASLNRGRADSFLTAGTVGIIYAIDEHHVIKVPSLGEFERQAYDREIRAYTRLGHHERIAHCEVQEEGLQLERGICLRDFLQSPSGSSIPLDSKLQWAQEAAEGLVYIHSKGIIHADVGCHNMILDGSGSGHVKFIDFAGSGIDDEDPLVCYEWCSFRPTSEIGVSTDIFAFGSMLFEIESGQVPYSELAKDPGMEMGSLVPVVERLFSENRFPPVEKLALGEIISGCWNKRYSSMVEVQEQIAFCIERFKI